MFNKKIILILIILLFVLGGVFAYQWWQTKKDQTVSFPTPSIQVSVTSETKIYRNEEWGFEFQHPGDWSFHTGTFYSPFSKFNLVGASPEESGRPNPLAPLY